MHITARITTRMALASALIPLTTLAGSPTDRPSLPDDVATFKLCRKFLPTGPFDLEPDGHLKVWVGWKEKEDGTLTFTAPNDTKPTTVQFFYHNAADSKSVTAVKVFGSDPGTYTTYTFYTKPEAQSCVLQRVVDTHNYSDLMSFNLDSCKNLLDLETAQPAATECADPEHKFDYYEVHSVPPTWEPNAGFRKLTEAEQKTCRGEGVENIPEKIRSLRRLAGDRCPPGAAYVNAYFTRHRDIKPADTSYRDAGPADTE